MGTNSSKKSTSSLNTYNSFSQVKTNKVLIKSSDALTIYTFGDSIIDCSRYNKHKIDPVKLLIKNDDSIFPEFIGKDLSNLLERKVELVHLAEDASVVDSLLKQVKSADFSNDGIAIVSIGGNDLLRGLVNGIGSFEEFEIKLKDCLDLIPIRPLLIGNVYDPTFGDDRKNFTSHDPKKGRKNHERMNEILKKYAEQYGILVDVHSHFLKEGKEDWYVHVIEPSIIGASEVRRLYLNEIIKLLD